MKCMSCEADIPSEWKAAIASNNCPKCGDVIMDDNTKKLFDELNSIMQRLEDAPEGVKDLLLSNYGLVTVEQAKQLVPEPTPQNLKIASNPVQQYLARSNSPKLAQRENLRDLVRRIQDVQSDEEPESVFVEPEIEDVPAPPTLAKKVLENNSLLVGSGNAPPPTEDEINALSGVLNVEQPDNTEIPAALQEDRLKRLEQRRRVASGVSGDKGTFRRGS